MLNFIPTHVTLVILFKSLTLSEGYGSRYLKGYNFGVDDDFEAIWMEQTAYCRVEFVEFMNWFSAVNIPQYTIIQDEIIIWTKGGMILKVVIGFVLVIQFNNRPSSFRIIDLSQVKKVNLIVILKFKILMRTALK